MALYCPYCKHLTTGAHCLGCGDPIGPDEGVRCYLANGAHGHSHSADCCVDRTMRIRPTRRETTTHITS